MVLLAFWLFYLCFGCFGLLGVLVYLGVIAYLFIFGAFGFSLLLACCGAWFFLAVLFCDFAPVGWVGAVLLCLLFCCLFWQGCVFWFFFARFDFVMFVCFGIFSVF